ncbi:MAG: protein-L-isoaspartate(D-aspartate) O-methyltransferase [Burkholderiales bacterium]|mgnify:FL=1|nr:protein-L-isoaspartate(D-aspartate) O-methyltransferase [Burkholderiales bacterium]PZN03052.1 MAG: protein-L-isoaspartate(D-aspartate) O-methyltransferase [Pseudomonadota bacterium]
MSLRPLSLARGIGMTSQRTRDRMVQRLRDQGIKDEFVLAAMAAVPRHIFVEEALASRAYEDSALPIGFEQTISQPYVVARMLEAARAGRELGTVLEVGTGCGYQAAVLARIAKQVYSIERIAPLLEKARANLRPLRIANLRLSHGDGYQGMPDAAPFDAIVVAAAATHVPPALLEQLAVGGRLVIPIGTTEQRLTVVERTESGYKESRLGAVRFVPMRLGKD